MINIAGEFVKKDLSKKYLFIQGLNEKAHNILNNFYSTGILSFGTTFQQVKNNTLLLRLLSNTLGKELSENPNKSKFGKTFLSDFDIFFNGNTDKKFNVLLESDKYKNVCGQLTLDKVKELRKERNKLLKKMNELLSDVIYDWELAGTPDSNEDKPKPVKTKKAVDKDINNRKNKLIEKYSDNKKQKLS